MDLDALSGVIAYKHTGEGVTTVTAALDRIIIQHPLTELCDLEYSGQVTYATGRSSMEITCRVARAPLVGQASKEEDVILTCTFTMVSLDPETKKYDAQFSAASPKSSPINILQISPNPITQGRNTRRTRHLLPWRITLPEQKVSFPPIPLNHPPQ